MSAVNTKQKSLNVQEEEQSGFGFSSVNLENATETYADDVEFLIEAMGNFAKEDIGLAFDVVERILEKDKP